MEENTWAIPWLQSALGGRTFKSGKTGFSSGSARTGAGYLTFMTSVFFSVKWGHDAYLAELWGRGGVNKNGTQSTWLSLPFSAVVPEHNRMNKLGIFPSPIHDNSQ